MRDAGDEIVVPLSGAIDRTAAAELAELAALAESQSKRLVLDLREATDLNSDGLRGLLASHRRLDGAGSALVVSHPSGAVRAVLAMTGMSDVLDIRD